jgi:hypothetical protein
VPGLVLLCAHDEVKRTLDQALELTRDIPAAHFHASSTERRFSNQAFLERLEILEDDVASATLSQPYASLVDLEVIENLAHGRDLGPVTDQEPVEAATGRRKGRTPGLSKDGGSISASMVELAGLEPATSCMPCRRSPS